MFIHGSFIITRNKNLCVCYLCNDVLYYSDMKDSAQTVPYIPNAKDPPLIKAVMTNLLPQTVVNVKKLDPGEKHY